MAHRSLPEPEFELPDSRPSNPGQLFRLEAAVGLEPEMMAGNLNLKKDSKLLSPENVVILFETELQSEVSGHDGITQS